MVLEMLQHEHDKVIVFELTDIFNHEPLDERLEFAVNHELNSKVSPVDELDTK